MATVAGSKHGNDGEDGLYGAVEHSLCEWIRDSWAEMDVDGGL